MTITLTRREREPLATAPRFTSTLAGTVTLEPVGAASWRVRAASGRIIGHVLHDEDGRFRACRFHVPTGRFVDLGTFWNSDDAVACVIWS